MAIADDELGELIRELDTSGDEQPPGVGADRSPTILDVASGREAAVAARRPRRWVQVAALVAAATIAIAGFAIWQSGDEPSATAIVRDAVEGLEEIDAYEVIGTEFEPGVGHESWSVRVDGDDATMYRRAIVDGRIEESVVTYVEDVVYVTSDGQTEVRPRTPTDRIESRYDELAAVVAAALRDAEVTVGNIDTFGGVEMIRYYVGLTEGSIAALSDGGLGDVIDDPESVAELRVCVADGEYMHEVHFIYSDGRTIDATLSIPDGDIDIGPPDGAAGLR